VQKRPEQANFSLDSICSIDLTNDMRTLAKRIKDLRGKRGLTQAALAKRAGLTLAYIGRLEIGWYDPQLSTLRQLAKALRVSVAELVG
jgi:transcriptional regulator with XRE-family HTH domain